LIAVGDVAGHGIGAALYMATARGIVRSRAHEGGTPGEIVTHLNRMLVEDMQSGRFMTLCLASIDPGERTIRWVRAGHDPAIVYDPASDAFTELDGGGGLPLGVEASAAYQDDIRSGLAEGQVILLGTDGIWETRDPGDEIFGKERLREVIRRSAGASASEISAAIEAALAEFRGDARPRDDVTFVVVKMAS
jgi:sigma-B regulation protein RsbU (phosphoserine phosphatase)